MRWRAAKRRWSPRCKGNAVGIGTTMLMHCDHVVAAADARFATPFVGLGLVPEAASSLIAPRLMGQARAFSLLVMGRPLGAEAAQSRWPRQYRGRGGRGRSRGHAGRARDRRAAAASACWRRAG